MKTYILLACIVFCMFFASLAPAQVTHQIGATTYDVQHHGSMGRQIEHRSSAYLHFGWTYKNNDILATSRFIGYQAYDLVDCYEIFNPGGIVAITDFSGFCALDADQSHGLGIISADMRTAQYLPATYWDFVAGGGPFGVFTPDAPTDIYGWYNNNGTGPDNENLWPKTDYDYDGVETVLHMVTTESGAAGDHNPGAPATISYYRRVGPYGTANGMWSAQRIIDTVMNVNVVVASSPVSDKVGIAWAAPCDYIRSNSSQWNIYENDIWYAVSTNQGADWIMGISSGSIRHEIDLGVANGGNITHYYRFSKWKAFCDLSTLIDSNDDFHVVWGCRRWSRWWPSSKPWMVPGTRVFRRQSAIFHWSDANGAISPVVKGMWDMGGPCYGHEWGSDVAKMSISECDDKLYILYTQFGNYASPCTDVDGVNQVVNGELYLTASDNGGIHWDIPQNITNTPTPGCWPGYCDSEYWASMARYGRIDYCDMPGEYVLDILYIDDKSAGGAFYPESGIWTTNPVNWLKYPCRDVMYMPGPPILTVDDPPMFPYEGFYKWSVAPGGSKTVALTLENPGNVENYFTIAVDYTDGSGWVNVSPASGAMPSDGTVDLEVTFLAPEGAADGSLWEAVIHIFHEGESMVHDLVAHLHVEQTHGTIATNSGPSIYDYELAQMLNTHIPTTKAQSTLLIFTECYGGDKLDDFAGRPNTTVLSATSPGEPAYYGGYHDDAATALDAGAGRTSADVHAAGVAGKNTNEHPQSQGPGCSLEPVNPEGPIKSRHVLYYAGIPNSMDNADRDRIKANFAGDNATTVTTVGSDGGDGYDYPGTKNGLRDAIIAISEQMDSTEQFILFVDDHGNIDEADPAPAFSRGCWVAQATNFTSEQITTIMDDPDNIPVITVIAQPEPDCIAEYVTISTSQHDFVDVPISDTIDLDGDGYFGGFNEGLAFVWIVEDGIVDWAGDVVTVCGDPCLNIVSIAVESGAISRLGLSDCDCAPGDANGDGTANVGDAVYLISYVFKGGPAPVPYATCSGDANGDCATNVGDAVYLISYVFKGGPPPVTCEEWVDACGMPLR